MYFAGIVLNTKFRKFGKQQQQKTKPHLKKSFQLDLWTQHNPNENPASCFVDFDKLILEFI